jgi:hypothetical protein
LNYCCTCVTLLFLSCRCPFLEQHCKDMSSCTYISNTVWPLRGQPFCGFFLFLFSFFVLSWPFGLRANVLAVVFPALDEMGAKSSKKKVERTVSSSGGTKFTLFNDKESFMFEEFDFNVEDLERSTADNRHQNSHGLPMDVLGLIASHLSLCDVGRVAQTCKTWRRMTLQPTVWLHFAKVLNVFGFFVFLFFFLF